MRKASDNGGKRGKKGEESEEAFRWDAYFVCLDQFWDLRKSVKPFHISKQECDFFLLEYLNPEFADLIVS